jgi:ribose-phosphate pyrophosphokinase
MKPVILSGGAHPALARALARHLGATFLEAEVERFPDGESHVRLPMPLPAPTVIVVQPLGPPVNDHLIELLLLIDACRRAGAATVITVVPYMGYARQDRRESGEAVGIRVIGDLIARAAPDRVVVVDPHIQTLEAVLGCPVDTVSAVPVLLDAIGDDEREGWVVVAPDLGAMKLAERYAAALDCPTAVVRKRRISGLEVTATEVLGDVEGRVPLIVDDMLSTGGTVCTAAALLLQRGCIPRMRVVATHGLFTGPAVTRLAAHPFTRILVTDTLPLAASTSTLPVSVAGIAGLIASTLRATVLDARSG